MPRCRPTCRPPSKPPVARDDATAARHPRPALSIDFARTIAQRDSRDLFGFGDPRHFRLTEVETLLGDPTKAREKLGRVPTTRFGQLVRETVESDYTAAKRESLVKLAG